MSRKNERSSFGEVSTERDGVSHWWEVKGTEVSIVRVLVSSDEDENGRRRDGAQDMAAEKGRRRLERELDEAACARAISTVGSFWPVSSDFALEESLARNREIQRETRAKGRNEYGIGPVWLATKIDSVATRVEPKCLGLFLSFWFSDQK